MTQQLHPTALIDPDTEIGSDVTIGPYAVVGPRITVGDGTTIGPHAVLQQDVRLGRRCTVGAGAVLGADPQDVKYQGEATWLEVGDDTIIREYSTLHRGTAARGRTSIGRRCFLMTYVHVAHDCVLEDDVTIANAVQLSGHVTIEAHATVSGLSPVHQFVRIGTYAYVGGGSRVPQDVPPYTTAVGNPLKLYGLNTVGLTRAGFPPEVRLALKHAYRLLFNSDLPQSEAVELVRREHGSVPEVMRLVDFVAGSERGVLV
ncbi:MAG: acyl-ACP--UDP-N-acetylglucosamine O-acyltransferase [Gemmatimonadota bacterium]|nr:MAG: acyl-ACP--UDP-N-acetylglucosamine O-acyltransferase [Gemmatimonadota bacterium]